MQTTLNNSDVFLQIVLEQLSEKYEHIQYQAKQLIEKLTNEYDLCFMVEEDFCVFFIEPRLTFISNPTRKTFEDTLTEIHEIDYRLFYEIAYLLLPEFDNLKVFEFYEAVKTWKSYNYTNKYNKAYAYKQYSYLDEEIGDYFNANFENVRKGYSMLKETINFVDEVILYDIRRNLEASDFKKAFVKIAKGLFLTQNIYCTKSNGIILYKEG